MLTLVALLPGLLALEPQALALAAVAEVSTSQGAVDTPKQMWGTAARLPSLVSTDTTRSTKGVGTPKGEVKPPKNALPQEERSSVVRDRRKAPAVAPSPGPSPSPSTTLATAEAEPPCGSYPPWQWGTYVAAGASVSYQRQVWRTPYEVPAQYNKVPPSVISGWVLVGDCPKPPPPTLTSMSPENGTQLMTVQPTLRAAATTWPGGTVGFRFELCRTPSMSGCVTRDEGVGLSSEWTVPEGTLAWGRQYWWRVRVSDASTIGGQWAYSPVYTFTIGVRQPTITSQLSIRGVNGQEFNQQSGNYTTTFTDAQVATVGPPLSVVRSFNSMDPRRDGAFGAGWATRWDMRIVPENVRGREAVLVTYPDGRQVRFAKKSDGSFQPPPGMHATFAKTADNGWRLMDKASTSYLFDADGRLLKVSDNRGRSQELTYGADGKLAKVSAPGGRSLTFSWTGSHVTTVSTDAVDGKALSWTYTYNGDVLEKVCNPVEGCTSYEHAPGSLYRSTVLDSDPMGYWRLGESTGSTSKDLGWLGEDAHYNTNYTLGKPGALVGTTDTAVDITASNAANINLPADIFTRVGTWATVETWFKTAGTGTVVRMDGSFAGDPYPMLQVTTAGKLSASFTETSTPIVSGATVKDGQWHHAVLTASGEVQTLYVDGQVAGTLTAPLDLDRLEYLDIGGGGLSGSIDEVAVYDRPLSAAEVARHYAARATAPHQLTKITLPSGRVWATNTYDSSTERIKTHTDEDGGTWQLGAPIFDHAVGTATIEVTDPNSKKTTAVHDIWRGYRLMSQTDQLGKKTTYDYDTGGYLSEVVDPNNNVVTQWNDDRGNTLSVRTCRTSSSCQTTYTAYYLNKDDQFDPRNDSMLVYRDARSSSNTDNTYATRWEYNQYGEQIKEITPATPDFPNGRSTGVTYTDGTEAAIGGGTTPAGLPASKTDARGNAWTYRYTASGDLAEQTDPEGLVTKLDYDALGRLITSTQVSDAYPDGVKTTFTYNGLSQPLTQTEPGVKNEITNVTHTKRTTFAYDGDGNKLSEKISDLTGGDAERATVYTYDPLGRVETVTDPEGGVVRQAWNTLGQLVRVTDPRGTVIENGYTDRGQLHTRTLKSWTGSPVDPQPAKDVILESYSYDAAGRLAAHVDPMGRKITYTYFNDNLLSQQIADDVKLNGSTTARDVVLEANTYDAAGNLTQQVVGGGTARADYVYDAAGRLTSETFDPSKLGRKTTYEYDANNNIVSTRLTAPDTTRVETTEYAYNKENVLVRETVKNDGQDLTTTWKVDDRGLLTEAVDGRGNAANADPAPFTTNLRYDLASRLVEITSPPVQVDKAGTSKQERTTSHLGYDNGGRQSHAVDGEKRVTTLAYDRAGRLASVTGMPYTPPGGTAVTPKTVYDYDLAGQLTAITNPRGQTTKIEYDALGNPVRITDPPAAAGQPAGQWVSHYDLAGEELASVDPTGARREATFDDLGRQITSTVIERKPTNAVHTTKLEYNDAGVLTKVILPGNKATGYTVNAAGEVTAETDPLGDTNTFTYDLAGRPLKATNPLGNAMVAGYDMAGRLTGLKNLDATGAAVKTVGYNYDGADNLTQITSGEGHIVRRKFDASNRPTELIEPVSDGETLTTSFGYDAAGARTRLTDGRGNATWTTYNSMGLIESLTEPATTAHPDLTDRTWTHIYDVAGNETALLQPGGVRLDRQFDQLNRLTKVTGSGAGIVADDKTYGYDLAGRLTTASDQTLEYNDRNLLTKVTGPNGPTSSFAYDELGNPTQRIDATGTTTYTWDNDNRLKTVTDPVSGRVNTYDYDKADRLTTVASTNPVNTQVYTYDALNRPATHTLKNSTGGQLAKITYGWDKDDNLTSKTTEGTAGAGTNTYTYDHIGRLTSWTGPDNTTTAYKWDASGNRIKAGDKTFTYDERNRLTTGDGTDYAYTPRGTLASKTKNGTTTHLTFDAFDRLLNDGNAVYTYDAFDRVATRKGQSEEQRFLYAGLDNDIIAITNSTGAIQSKYGRDPFGDLLSLQEGTGPAVGALTDIHDDLIGTFSGTALASSTAYNPYGEVSAQTGTKPTLGYQSEYTDPDTGNVNMHARWYQPGTGTFTSRDTWTLSPYPSIQANRYTYVGGSPLTNTDPTGHDKDYGGAGGGGGSARGGNGGGVGVVHPPQQQVHVPGQRKPLDNTIGKRPTSRPTSSAPKPSSKPTRPPSKKGSQGSYSGVRPVTGNSHDARENLQGEKNQCRVHNCAGPKPKKRKPSKPQSQPQGQPQGQPQVCTKPGGCGAKPPIRKTCTVGCTTTRNTGNPVKPRPKKIPPVPIVNGPLHSIPPAPTPAEPEPIFIDEASITRLDEHGGDPDFFNTIINCGFYRYSTGTCVDGVAAVDPELADPEIIDPVYDETPPPPPIFDCTPPNSFIPGTRVLMADGTSKPIEHVRIGDLVVATDPTKGRTEARPVTALIASQGVKELVKISVDTDESPGSASAAITATSNHPFWIPDLRLWVRAGQLQRGMWLQTSAGAYVQVTAIQKWTAAQRVHNLTVEELHTYHVLADNLAILVHNVGPNNPGPGPDIIWRNDSRPPEVIAREGFQPWGTSDDLEAYTRKEKAGSIYVGFFKSEKKAKVWHLDEPRWVYAVRNPGGGIDVNRALGWRYRVFGFGASEKEIAIPGGVGADHIISARPVHWGEYTDC
ncbi:LamG-like jellyroll fold domain-containing protein [Nonomuraea indica]|uniref:LamG-like jellyroll fold domain-containing protein n=1 Tax=Nonomuraea indica TaxID=1581193 RepID=A0ABW7ZUW1_9ACTN